MPSRDYVESSGNVFADLGLPKPDDLLAKAELTAKIIEEIQRRRLTQSQAAAILGIDQPKVSALKQGHLSSFSNRAPDAIPGPAWAGCRNHREAETQAPGTGQAASRLRCNWRTHGELDSGSARPV